MAEEGFPSSARLEEMGYQLDVANDRYVYESQRGQCQIRSAEIYSWSDEKAVKVAAKRIMLLNGLKLIE